MMILGMNVFLFFVVLFFIFFGELMLYGGIVDCILCFV